MALMHLITKYVLESSKCMVMSFMQLNAQTETRLDTSFDSLSVTIQIQNYINLLYKYDLLTFFQKQRGLKFCSKFVSLASTSTCHQHNYQNYIIPASHGNPET